MFETVEETKLKIKGYKCKIKKISLNMPSEEKESLKMLGTEWYCGYIKIPLNNKYGDYDAIKCHGGITYNQMGITGHWIGFDCHHLNDTIEVQNYEYVENELESIIEQLEAVK